MKRQIVKINYISGAAVRSIGVFHAHIRHFTIVLILRGEDVYNTQLKNQPDDILLTQRNIFQAKPLTKETGNVVSGILRLVAHHT